MISENTDEREVCKKKIELMIPPFDVLGIFKTNKIYGLGDLC
jgi:hypothetical protein